MTTIEIPTTFVSDLIAQATAFLANLSPYLALIIGVLLAVVIAEILISAIRR